MRKNALGKTVSLVLALGMPTIAAEAEDAVLSGSAAPASGEIVVKAHSGRFDLVATSKVSIPLKLNGSLSEAGHNRKIIGSSLFLKQSGTRPGMPVTDATDGEAPSRKLTADSTFEFEIDPQGPVAQNAIALCNTAPGSRAASMSSPVIWRITTGRFNFKWVNYDNVAPSPEIIANPDFYADQETHEVEIAANIPVTCETEAATAALAAPKAESAKKGAIAKREAKPAIETAKLVADEPAIAAAEAPEPPKTAPGKASTEDKLKSDPVKSAALESADAPVCDGGMVRKTGSGNSSFACLCPGNTLRVETGTNSFSCERRTGRRS